MKAIFLDIDGVLNSEESHNPRDFPYFIDRRLLDRFTELVRVTEAKVILSSSWRIDQYYCLPLDDVCPDMPGAPRCDEVITWLREHPEVTRYVVLDDEDDCLDELPLFQPSSRTGLTLELSKGIEEFLAGRSNNDMRANALTRIGQNIHALFKRDKS